MPTPQSPDQSDHYIDRWLKYKQFNQNRAGNTIVRYRGYLKSLADYLPDDLLNATTEQIETYTGLHLHKEGFAGVSRHVAVAAIRGFYDYLLTHGVIQVNPAKSLPYPKKSLKLPVSFGLENAEAILMMPDISTFIGLRDMCMMAVLIGCGLRVSGLCSLNESSLVWFRHDDLDRLSLKVIEKGDKERMVPVPLEATLLLQAYLGHNELAAIDRQLADFDRVLFITTQNRIVPNYDYIGESRRMTPRSVDKIIKKYAAQAGVPVTHAHAHAMRHLAGAEMAEASMTSFEIQAMLGHASPTTTAKYLHLANRKLTTLGDKSNPLGKITTPVTGLRKEIYKR